jgi:hypothetical protein
MARRLKKSESKGGSVRDLDELKQRRSESRLTATEARQNRVAQYEGPHAASSSAGYAFMREKTRGPFSEVELLALISAASKDPWLVDNFKGNVRLMDDDGHEVDRATRDPAQWTKANADGRLVVMYGPQAVKAVRSAVGARAPQKLPSIEDEKALLGVLRAEQLKVHSYALAWRLRWAGAAVGEWEIAESDPPVPQLWWAVAQNVIVPLKVLELHRRHPAIQAASSARPNLPCDATRRCMRYSYGARRCSRTIARGVRRGTSRGC